MDEGNLALGFVIRHEAGMCELRVKMPWRSCEMYEMVMLTVVAPSRQNACLACSTSSSANVGGVVVVSDLEVIVIDTEGSIEEMKLNPLSS